MKSSFRAFWRPLDGCSRLAGSYMWRTRLADAFRLICHGVRDRVLAGWLLMLASTVRELSSSIFLYVPDNETIAVVISRMWQEAQYSKVSVLALTLVGISVPVVMLSSACREVLISETGNPCFFGGISGWPTACPCGPNHGATERNACHKG